MSIMDPASNEKHVVSDMATPQTSTSTATLSSSSPPSQEKADAPPVPPMQHEDHSRDADTTQEWTVVSDAMKQHDERIIADWKDDLANLLIFTGLFSAVVTGFAVESYTWLQQSGPDPYIQVQLLAQISAQLASFSVAPGFLNSTSQPTLLEINPPSGPSELDIRINTLWFLSLGISLVSSLLAIMVQQWLREYRVPGHLTIREHVRLRQYRYQGLLDWGVPHIVSVLPILLQVALVLFLTGLCYLLASLDEIVAKSFIAFVGISLSAYFAFVVLPIAFRTCPYKNPLAVIIKNVLHNVLILAFYCVAFVPFLFIAVISTCRLVWDLGSVNRNLVIRMYWTSFYHLVFRAPSFLYHTLTAFGRGDYWITRELQALPERKDLDRDALAWAPSAVSKRDLPQLDQCLLDLTSEQRLRCVVLWTAQALHIRPDIMDEGVTTATTPFDTETLAKIDSTFAHRFQNSLLQALPAEFGHGDWDVSTEHSASLLVMLRQLTKTGVTSPKFITQYAEHLMTLRAAQTSEDISTFRAWVRLPTACLYECSTRLGFEFTDEDVSRLFDQALQMQAATNPFNTDVPITTLVSAIELIFVSAATALHGVSRLPAVPLDIVDKCRSLFAGLDHVLIDIPEYVKATLSYGEEGFQDGVLLSICPAMVTICQSIAKLFETNSLPDPLGPEGSELTLALLVDHMVETMKQEDDAAEAMAVLVQFRDTKLLKDTAPDNALDGKTAINAVSISGDTAQRPRDLDGATTAVAKDNKDIVVTAADSPLSKQGPHDSRLDA